MNRETLADRIRLLRQQQDLDVRYLAARCAVSEATFRQYESGHTKSPSLATGLRLADAFGVDPYYLAFGNEGSTTERLERMARRLDAIERKLDERA